MFDKKKKRKFTFKVSVTPNGIKIRIWMLVSRLVTTGGPALVLLLGLQTEGRPCHAPAPPLPRPCPAPATRS